MDSSPGKNNCEEIQEMELMESISDCRFEELSLARQIEAKTRELEQLERLTKLKDSCAQENAILETLNGVSVLSVSDEQVCLQIKTHITNMALDGYKSEASNSHESLTHKLQIKLEPATLLIQDAELIPRTVDIREIVSAVQREGVPGSFLEQLPFLIKQVQSCIRSRSRSTSITNGSRIKKR